MGQKWLEVCQFISCSSQLCCITHDPHSSVVIDQSWASGGSSCDCHLSIQDEVAASVWDIPFSWQRGITQWSWCFCLELACITSSCILMVKQVPWPSWTVVRRRVYSSYWKALQITWQWEGMLAALTGM